jgi:glutamate N-acetyltransferase/amino-acid N-acetyltransferase
VARNVRFREIDGGVTAAQGFSAAGVGCGIKTARDALDLGLILSDRLCSVAGVFTTIKAPSAAVTWDREIVAGGRARAVVVNSGNANACTGKKGERDAARMAALAANRTGLDAAEVCVASTGVIGHPLPMAQIAAGIADAADALAPDADGAAAFARAIMTTDLVPKTVAVRTVLDGAVVTIGGAAKGSGMISPNLATMLSFITTDAAISPAQLRRALTQAVDVSFNGITVDGDMSTNDTVLVLASGAAGNAKITRGSRAFAPFADALRHVCVALAQQIVRDGEGATKFVEISVRRAASAADAKRAAAAVANSPLVKCALNGEDPNWGRIVCRAAGCGVAFDPSKTRLRIGGKLAYARGVPARTPLADLQAAMKETDIHIDLDLGLGQGTATMWTCDLSRDYVRINADYHT